MTTPYIPRLYGRQQDKPLKPRQARLMDELLPSVAITLNDEMNEGEARQAQTPIDLAGLFEAGRDQNRASPPPAKKYWLEVGFGGGEHLAWQAAHNPDVGMIGAEPFINGVAKLLTQIDEQQLENVRIQFGDARPLIEAIPDGALDRIFVLHPDPWPKKRHHKRRMISPWFFEQAARLIAPGGELRVASDIPDYIRWTLMHGQNAHGFVWRAQRPRDWRIRPDDWPQTRYERKALREGRPPAYLIYDRV